MDLMESRKYLLTLLAELADAWAEWTNDDATNFPARLAKAVEETINGFAGDTLIPSDVRDLERRVYDLQKQYEPAKEAAGGTWSTGSLPGNGFWSALEHVLDGRELLLKPRARRVESIQALTDQRVSDNQICKIYGWLDPDGRPQLEKLDEERAKPGTHTSDWVNPHEKQQDAIQQRQAESLAALREKQSEKVGALLAKQEASDQHE